MYDDKHPGDELQLPPPFDIDSTKPLYAFHGPGSSEMSAAALWVVRVCQTRSRWGRWKTSTRKTTETGSPSIACSLAAGSNANRGDTGRYRVTLEFVARCWKASPMARQHEEELGDDFDAEARGVLCTSGVD